MKEKAREEVREFGLNSSLIAKRTDGGAGEPIDRVRGYFESQLPAVQYLSMGEHSRTYKIEREWVREGRKEGGEEGRGGDKTDTDTHRDTNGHTQREKDIHTQREREKDRYKQTHLHRVREI